MKKLLILIVSLMITVSGFASYTSDMVKKMEDREKRLETMFEGSNADLKNATSIMIDSWDDELNKIYKLLMAKLPEPEKVKLRNEEREWIKKKEKAAKSTATQAACDDDVCGTIYGVVYGGVLLEYTQNRAIELAKRYDKLKK